MKSRIYLSGMAFAASMLLVLASGCASSSSPSSSPSSFEQSPMTSHMKSAVGTPDELSPIAPAEARNVRKVGNQWMCDLNGQVMVYNSASGQWEPKH